MLQATTKSLIVLQATPTAAAALARASGSETGAADGWLLLQESLHKSVLSYTTTRNTAGGI